MGPLQVLGMSVVERMYDGQMCLAQKFANIVWQVLFKYYTSVVKHRNPRYCLASITGRSFGRPFRVYDMWIIMLITCEPITYIMLNG